MTTSPSPETLISSQTLSRAEEFVAAYSAADHAGNALTFARRIEGLTECEMSAALCAEDRTVYLMEDGSMVQETLADDSCTLATISEEEFAQSVLEQRNMPNAHAASTMHRKQIAAEIAAVKDAHDASAFPMLSAENNYSIYEARIQRSNGQERAAA